VRQSTRRGSGSRGKLRRGQHKSEEGGQEAVHRCREEAQYVLFSYSQAADVKIRCFIFDATKELCFHLDNQRSTNTYRTHFSKRVGKIPVHSFFKNFEPPALSEGFYEVAEVKFVPGPFENKKDAECFFRFSEK